MSVVDFVRQVVEQAAPLPYSVRYHCGNCHNTAHKNFPRGQLAPQITECPRCGCNEARKT